MSDLVPSLPEMVGTSPGVILRRCREFHGITLEEASETTKIGVSHLKALEDDQISAFANQAYLRGFLRIYATYLGLDSADVSRMYDKLFGVQSEKLDSARTPVTPPQPPRRLISLKKLLFPAFLLAVILITATFFKRPPSTPVRPPTPAVIAAPAMQNTVIQMAQSSARKEKVEKDTAAPKVEKPPTESADPEPPVTSGLPITSKIPITSKMPADVPKGFILKVKATQSGTLTATVDDSGSQQYELASGDVIVWKAEKNVILELSNAGGVDIELNGKPHKPIGPLGEPAYIELDANGVKQ